MSTAKAVIITILYGLAICVSFNNECPEWLETVCWVVAGIVSGIFVWTSLQKEEDLEKRIATIEQKIEKSE